MICLTNEEKRKRAEKINEWSNCFMYGGASIVVSVGIWMTCKAVPFMADLADGYFLTLLGLLLLYYAIETMKYDRGKELWK